MLDIGWPELFIVGVVTLVVVGPKEIPRVLRMVMVWVRKARSLAREFQNGLDEMVRESELDEIKRELDSTSNLDLEKEIEETIDPTGSLGQAFEDNPLAEEAPPREPETRAAEDEPAPEVEEAKAKAESA